MSLLESEEQRDTEATNNISNPKLRSCVKAEVAVLGSPSVIVRKVSVDVKRQQSSGAV